MRKNLFSSLLLCLGFAACADHAGSVPSADGPQPPVNEPDTRIIEPSGGSVPGGTTAGGGLNEGGSTGGGTGTGSGGNTGGGQPGGSGGSSNGGEPGGQGNGTEGGGGSPVPEPGTLLLVGTGLAGLAGAALRRRRRQPEAS